MATVLFVYNGGLPPADALVERESAALNGRLGTVVTLRKSNNRGMSFFFGKAWKKRFSFCEKPGKWLLGKFSFFRKFP